MQDESDDTTQEDTTSNKSQARHSQSGSGLRRPGISWPQPGDTLADRFQFRKLLGSGGYGEVWEALNLQLRVKVAIKLPNTSKLNPEDLERFRREARALCLIHNEHVLRFFEYNTEPTPYLVMELLKGHDLEEHIKKHGPLPLHLVKLICKQLCAGLQAVHDAGIIHRDIKPSNIYCLVDPLKVKLVDFGLMKLVKDVTDTSVESTPKKKEELTMPGTVLGTPKYMSPEQWSLMDQVISSQSDLWSLAIVLYKALTCDTPFKGKTNILLARSIMYSPVPEVSKIRPDLPPGVDDFFQRALQKDPGSRFGSALEMSGAFEAIQEPPPAPIDQPIDGSGEIGLAETVREAVVPNSSKAEKGGVPPGRSRVRLAILPAFIALLVVCGATAAVLVYFPKTSPAPECSASMRSCDGDDANGCEVDITKDARHCGKCGVICVSKNGTSSCVGGACVQVCDGGFSDCDKDAANGCETDTRTSDQHCGACGHACNSANGAQGCGAGACVIASGGEGAAGMAVDLEPEGHVYWTNPSSRVVQMAPKLGGDVRTLWSKGAAESIVAGPKYVFWIDSENPSLIVYPKGAASIEEPYPLGCSREICAPSGLATSGDRAYWTKRNKANPRDLPELFIDEQYEPILKHQSLLGFRGLAVDQLNIYWIATSELQGALWKLTKGAPGSPQKLLDIPGEPSALVLDQSGGFIYWSERGSREPSPRDGVISRAPTGAGEASRHVLATSQEDPRSVAVDKEWVYWSTADGSLRKVRKDGAGAPAVLAVDPGPPVSVAVDDQYVFWLSSKTGDIKRVVK